MNPDRVVIRFDQVAEQTEGSVRRVVGLVRAKNMLQLFDAADLEANPREAKAGAVTADIIESIEQTPDTFPFKTKGVLVGASDYEALQRNRYELRFENPKVEGVLDGGHNMLAIGTYIIAKAAADDKLMRRLKTWPQMKEAWGNHRQDIEALKKGDDETGGALDFLVPLEVLVPSDVENEASVSDFNRSLLDICAARNNNVELKMETRANQKGFYEEFRKALPREIAERFEWKTNDGGDIKVRDLIALAWIPLSLLTLPIDIKISPQNIYRNKGDCVKHFDELMSHSSVSKRSDGDYTHELSNSAVHSALVIAAQLPRLYDEIYLAFPDAYNGNGEGRFGRLGVVKMAKDMRSKPTTPFTLRDTDYSYPEGLIMPIVYGLKALMEVDENGCVRWKQDPLKFLRAHLETIVKKYRVVMDAFRADPQKVGKHEGSYELVLDAFETELLKRHATN